MTDTTDPIRRALDVNCTTTHACTSWRHNPTECTRCDLDAHTARARLEEMEEALREADKLAYWCDRLSNPTQGDLTEDIRARCARAVVSFHAARAKVGA